MKIAAVVPALNEEKTVGNVLRTLLESKKFNEIILVDGGSKDRTVEIAKELDVKVIKAVNIGGKGQAMRKGVESTDAEIIVFFDSDLLGLKKEHIYLLIEPVEKGEAAMCVGLRERYGGMPAFIAKIDPIGGVIGGERALKRSIFLGVPEKFIKGFAVETALNYFCRKNKLKVKLVKLEGLDIVIKEKKWGFWKGFLNRLKMFFQLFKIRIMILLFNKQFKIKN